MAKESAKTKKPAAKTAKKPAAKKPDAKKAAAKPAAKKTAQKPAASAPKNPQNMANQPLFQLLSQYARDISVECATPAYGLKAEPQVGLDVGLASRPVGDDRYEVILKLRCDAREEGKDSPAYLVEVEYVGEYRIQNIAPEQMRALMAVDGAALIFPFARQVVMDSITAIGHRPRLIEPVNFAGLYMQSQQQQQQGDVN